MSIKREVKHIRGLARVLYAIASDIERRGFKAEDLLLLKKVGSDIVFKGAALDFVEEVEEC